MINSEKRNIYIYKKIIYNCKRKKENKQRCEKLKQKIII